MSDRFTLDEAAAEIAKRECAAYGHSWTAVMEMGSGIPVRFICDRCPAELVVLRALPPSAKNDSKGKREQRKRQRARLRAEALRLRRAITEHRTAIVNAGSVRVDVRDEAAAAAKHAADKRLWDVLDGA